jgi:hypothetical protein
MSSAAVSRILTSQFEGRFSRTDCVVSQISLDLAGKVAPVGGIDRGLEPRFFAIPIIHPGVTLTQIMQKRAPLSWEDHRACECRRSANILPDQSRLTIGGSMTKTTVTY